MSSLELMIVMMFFSVVFLVMVPPSQAFHDPIKSPRARQRRQQLYHQQNGTISENTKKRISPPASSSCSGGICMGLKNASYPVNWKPSSSSQSSTTTTFVHSTLVVPPPPKKTDNITYYIWTDVYFDNAGLGRMNQLVPQLMFGSVLDSSSGPPNYEAMYHDHDVSWVFGSHYFFEIYDEETSENVPHAAYGDLFQVEEGEVLITTFELLPSKNDDDDHHCRPQWILTMKVDGDDDDRISKLVVDRPYMGLGLEWEEATSSWAESHYEHMYIGSCWELYGAVDADHLPSGGSTFEVLIRKGEDAASSFEFKEWERDEGNGVCPSGTIVESHDDLEQHVRFDIHVSLEEQQEEETVWNDWKMEHNMTYRDDIEESYRRRVFMDNIHRFQKNFQHGTFTLDEMAAFTNSEFRSFHRRHGGCSSHTHSFSSSSSSLDDELLFKKCSTLPRPPTTTHPIIQPETSVDYRHTKVTPPKNQGVYGTCWSFAFVESIESLNVIQGHALTNLSNQELIDCCEGCRGVSQDASYDFVVGKLGGRMVTEASYPYEGKVGECRVNVTNKRLDDNDVGMMRGQEARQIQQQQQQDVRKVSHDDNNTNNNTTKPIMADVKVGGCIRALDDVHQSGDPLLKALITYGPGAFGMDSSCLRGYESGIITDCGGDDDDDDFVSDHAVLLVGAGMDDETGMTYFVAKNSWGEDWGEKGYFRFQRKGVKVGMGSPVFPLGV